MTEKGIDVCKLRQRSVLTGQLILYNAGSAVKVDLTGDSEDVRVDVYQTQPGEL
jgi:hypothetical protein